VFSAAALCPLYNGPLENLERTKIWVKGSPATHIWQNLVTLSTPERAYNILPNPPLTMNNIHAIVGGEWWRTHDTSFMEPTRRPPPQHFHASVHNRPRSPPRPTAHTQHRDYYIDGTPITPSPEVKEALMGFTAGDTAAPGLNTEQRNHMLGQCTDLNILNWTLSIVRNAPTRLHNPNTRECPNYPGPSTYTFSQPLPNLEVTRAIPSRNREAHNGQTNARVPLAPEIWTPKFTPE